MKQSLFQEKYPVFALEIGKSETTFKSVDEIAAHLRGLIEADPRTVFIALFDHYAHTRSLPEGEIAPEIVDAKNVVFCFGMKLPGPAVMAVRPRSIGITDLGERFVVNFLEAPMPVANQAMEQWVLGLRNA